MLMLILSLYIVVQYYQVFEDNSVYKLQEFVLDDNSTAGDDSDDYFRQQGSPFNASSADMSASITALNNTSQDAYAPSQDINLYLGQTYIDASFAGVSAIDSAVVYGLMGSDASGGVVHTLYKYEDMRL